MAEEATETEEVTPTEAVTPTAAEEAFFTEKEPVDALAPPQEDAEDKGSDAPEATEPKVPEATEWTAKQASALRRFGYDQDELEKAFGPDKAQTFADKLAKTHADVGRRYAQLGRAERKPEPTAEAPPETGAEEALEFKYDPEESVLSATEGQAVEKLFATVKGLRESLAGATKHLEVQRAQQREQTADTWFASLDTDVYPIFGEGPGGKLEEDSEELAARLEILDYARELTAGHLAVHGEEMPIEDALTDALLHCHPDARAAARKKTTAKKVKTRSGQLSARPGTRQAQGAPKDVHEAALDAMAEHQKTKGHGFFKDV